MINKGRLQPVYVNDVCDIIINLINNKKIRNKTYCVACEDIISLNNLINRIADLFSKKIIKIHIPLWFLWLPIKIYNLLQKKSLINYETLSILCKDKVCEIDEVRGDLDSNPVSLEEGLKSVFF